MIAEILATGDEIRSGNLVDTNSGHIAQQLEIAGCAVTRHTCVGDEPDALLDVIQEIAKRADVAIVTGGLGPTSDDITAPAFAAAAGVEMVLDSEALENVVAYFRKRERPMSESNRKQALIPAGAAMIPNRVGTAPGFSVRIGRCTFFCLPGVPSEMKQMMGVEVMPRLFELQGDGRGYRKVKVLSSFGLTESVVGERLEKVESVFSRVKLGLRAHFPEIQVRLYGNDASEDGLDALLEEAAAWVREELGHHLFSEDGQTLHAVVGNLLRERKETLAVAESCTGGLIAHQLTDVPGTSDYFNLGAVTYANEAKIEMLGVSQETLIRHGAVHEKTAEEMAAGIRKLGRTTYGLSTTGIAGPTGGSAEKPVGTVCIGLAGPDGPWSKRYFFSFHDRFMNKKIFAMTALNRLRLTLIRG